MARVAFQGDRGAFSELAATALWPGAEHVPMRGNSDVARAVAAAEVDAGVLAIENTLAGTVTDTDDALLRVEGTRIVSETIVPIHHCVLGVRGASLRGIRCVESHPVALEQCRGFFERHPEIQPRAAYDTAGAAREVAAAADPARAALAGRHAAKHYGLAVLAKNVEDRGDNQTRFIGIARDGVIRAPDAMHKTSLAITVDDEPGALVRLLQPIAAAGLSLTRLSARPTGEPWEYVFVLDVEHGGSDDRLTRLVEQLATWSRQCRVLGTFPSARQRLATGGAATRTAIVNPGVRAIRGAVGATADTPAAIRAAVDALVNEIMSRNRLAPARIISATFTMTPDLTSAFPATFAREAGWRDVPLICASEIAVPGSLPRCIRVLVHVEGDAHQPVEHVYMRGATALRPDLAVLSGAI